MENQNSIYKKTYEEVVSEITIALSKIAKEDVEQLKESIVQADKVFVVGVGRVLISLQAWVKRFTQLGIKIYFVGEVVEPAITDKDLLIVGSGSGSSLFPVAIARKAKDLGAKVIHIGSNPHGEVSEVIDYMLRIPVQTKLYLPDEILSTQPMTSLFEQVIYLLGDIIAKMLIEEKNIEMKQLWQYHANLE